MGCGIIFGRYGYNDGNNHSGIQIKRLVECKPRTRDDVILRRMLLSMIADGHRITAFLVLKHTKIVCEWRKRIFCNKYLREYRREFKDFHGCM